MQDLKFIIAKNIQKLRQEKGMTQLELAETVFLPHCSFFSFSYFSPNQILKFETLLYLIMPYLILIILFFSSFIIFSTSITILSM